MEEKIVNSEIVQAKLGLIEPPNIMIESVEEDAAETLGSEVHQLKVSAT
jgi:hypothetical protein